jgi:protein-S-isoprenylcysteine O-methyltransferase Ste14
MGYTLGFATQVILGFGGGLWGHSSCSEMQFALWATRLCSGGSSGAGLQVSLSIYCTSHNLQRYRGFDSNVYGVSEEEQLLIKFFGDTYVVYRNRTPVGIPFIP